MRTLFSFILLVLVHFGLSAQRQLSEVIILNEGYFNYLNNKIEIPVSVASYNPSSKEYNTLFEIPNARFASDLLVYEKSLWVAADQQLIEYDLITRKIKRNLFIEGIRKIAISGNLLVVTRGEYNKTLDSYVQFYNLSDLSLRSTIPYNELPYTCENIIINGLHIYIAVNNGFDWGKEVGQILDINIVSLKFNKIIDLGEDGKNPENLVLNGQQLFSVNNKNFTGSSISKIELSDASVHTTNLPNIASLCGTSALVKDQIFYQESGKTEIGLYNTNQQTAQYFKDAQRTFYGMNFESVESKIYAGVTDFKTYGKVYIYDDSMNELAYFDAGVSPGNFAFVYQSATATENLSFFNFIQTQGTLSLDPNCSIHELKLFSQEGKLLLNLNVPGHTVQIGQLSPGVYSVVGTSAQKTYSQKLLIF